MNIIIPMAGAGKRFSDAGYKTSKPSIPTIERRTGKELPMVVCATLDLPGVANDGSNVTYIDRDFHTTNGTEEKIRSFYPGAHFITVDHLTKGQACTCLLAENRIDNDEELLIAGCDNGMVYSEEKFEQAKKDADVLVFTYRHNETVLEKPDAYGWMKVDDKGRIIGTSIKKAISDNPMEDHAVVATFWFKHGKDFVIAAKDMISADDKVNNEFYVDKIPDYAMRRGLKCCVFEIERYICWGTPKDYEIYQNTYKYWKAFLKDQRCPLSIH